MWSLIHAGINVNPCELKGPMAPPIPGEKSVLWEPYERITCYCISLANKHVVFRYRLTIKFTSLFQFNLHLRKRMMSKNSLQVHIRVWSILYVFVVYVDFKTKVRQTIGEHYDTWWRHQMQTFSSALCSGHRWIPLTKASDEEIWYFYDLRLE